MKNLALVVVLLVSSSVGAQQPTVTPHPVEVMFRDVKPAEVEKLQLAYRSLLSKAKITIPAKGLMATALGDLKRQDCATSDDCLQRLAILGGTLYALHVSAAREPRTGSATLVARVVRDDGKLVLGPLTRTEARQGTEGLEVTVTRALSALLQDARLASLPASREAAGTVAAPVEPEKVDAGVPAGVVAPVDAGVALTAPPPSPLAPSSLETVGTVTLVSGAGLAVVGGIILGVGAFQASGLTIQGGAVSRAQADQAVTANTLQGVGTGLLVAGGVGAAAGLVMRLVGHDAPASKMSISAAPVHGGATFTIGGSL